MNKSDFQKVGSLYVVRSAGTQKARDSIEFVNLSDEMAKYFLKREGIDSIIHEESFHKLEGDIKFNPSVSVGDILFFNSDHGGDYVRQSDYTHLSSLLKAGEDITVNSNQLRQSERDIADSVAFTYIFKDIRLNSKVTLKNYSFELANSTPKKLISATINYVGVSMDFKRAIIATVK